MWIKSLPSKVFDNKMFGEFLNISSALSDSFIFYFPLHSWHFLEGLREGEDWVSLTRESIMLSCIPVLYVSQLS